MVDANFVQYGEDALRVTDSMGDVMEFGAQNGYALGVIIAVFLVFFIVLIMLALIVKFGRKLIP